MDESGTTDESQTVDESAAADKSENPDGQETPDELKKTDEQNMPDKPNGDGRKDLEEEKAPEKSETGETAGEAGPKEPGQTDPETSTDDATPETDEPLDHTASKETEETNKETADSEKADNTESAEVQEDGVPKTAESEMPNEVLAVNPEDGLETHEGDIAGGVDGDITWRIDADGKLTVNGTGDVTNTDAWPWASYRENIVSAEVNVTGMTDASGMFSYCSNLNSLDLSNFDTSNVTHMRDMFSGCTGMTKIFTPCNVNVSTVLPLVLDEFWFLPDGTEITELPQNLDHSVAIIRCRNPKIITTTSDLNMDDVIWVKYVPYSYTVETNNWDEDNKVTFSIEKGELAKGLQIYPETGEIYGVPLETGEFPITVKASYSNPEYFPSYADLSLTVIDNTDNNVLNASDAGYAMIASIGVQVFDSAGSFSYIVTESEDQLFVSEGVYDEFIDFWLNGEKLVAGEDYTSESGSTRITIPKQTLEEKAIQDGINTIAAEFRVGGNLGNALKRTAQNFRMDMITRRRNPKIITTTPDLNMDDVIRVKYVPYSYTVETNNWDEDNKVTFSIEKGELAEGLQIYPETGEIYGVPLETGKFPITVKASYSNPEYFPSYADLTLTVIDNTDSNVLNASDAGYEVEQYIGSQVFDSTGSSSYVVTESDDQLFVSAGEYNEFIDFWLNGEKLVAGEDYTKESGSTRITIQKQTLEGKAIQDGTNTIAAEFRVGGNPDNALKRTAQNFRMDIQGGSSNNEHGSGSGSGSRGRGGDSGGSSSGGGTESVSYATSVIRLVDASGNPLPDTALELHSTPQEARTDRNGIAVFAGVETGVHTLYAKDGNGTVFALKSFELLFGEHTGINGDQITVKAGAAFTLSVQVDGNELKFLSLRDGDLYQVVSAATGDNDVPLMWFLLSMLSAGAVSGSIRYRRRKQYAG